jgi:hypothetical protein
MSLPPRLAGAEGMAVTDMGGWLAAQAPSLMRRAAESGRRSLREDRRGFEVQFIYGYGSRSLLAFYVDSLRFMS